MHIILFLLFFLLKKRFLVIALSSFIIKQNKEQKHMKKKVLLSVLFLASCLSLGSCRIIGVKGDTGPTGPSGAQGEKGDDGEDGESPTITISDDGYWVINGVKSNVKATGQKGEDGVSIQNIEKTSTSGSVDTYTITYSDGSTSTFKVTNGVDGNQGIQGEKGDTGDKGDSGEPGTKWIYDQGNPIDLNKTSNEGDFYFDTDSGNVFTYTNSTWNYVTNFRYKIDHNNENHEFTVYSMDQIEAALAAVKDGDKIVCGSNIEFDNNMFVTRNIEFHFDFNGYTLSNTVDLWKDYDWSFFSVRGGKMIFDDSKGTGGIKAKANDCYCLDIQGEASIEINGGSYNGNDTAIYVVVGNLVINGGYFDIQQLDDESPYGFVINAYDPYFKNGFAKMVIKGGKFHGYNPGNATSEAGANLVPDGYQVKSETSGSDTYYSVSKVQ